MKQFFTQKLKGIHIGIAAVLTLIMLGIMDIVTLPAIANAAGGIPAFDLQTFGYSKETAMQFLQALSADGRALFLHVQLPLDFAFAFVYTFLFLALFYRLHPLGSKLIFLPVLLFVLDLAENTRSVLFLKLDTIPDALFTLGSCVTLAKNACTLACGILIIVFLILWFKNRKKQKSEAKK